MSDILIVDDENLYRSSLRTALEAAGHVVREASEGNAALRICAERLPQLIIMDLVLEGKEGIETIMEIRRRKLAVKILAISRADYLNMAMLLGADQALNKPISHEAMLTLVKKTLGE